MNFNSTFFIPLDKIFLTKIEIRIVVVYFVELTLRGQRFPLVPSLRGTRTMLPALRVITIIQCIHLHAYTLLCSTDPLQFFWNNFLLRVCLVEQKYFFFFPMYPVDLCYFTLFRFRNNFLVSSSSKLEVGDFYRIFVSHQFSRRTLDKRHSFAY